MHREVHSILHAHLKTENKALMYISHMKKHVSHQSSVTKMIILSETMVDKHMRIINACYYIKIKTWNDHQTFIPH